MPLPNGYLLDTNIVVALVRDNDLGKYLDRIYRLTAGTDIFYVSVVLLGEIRALAQKLIWGPAKQASMESILLPFRVIDINFEDVIQAYADIDAHSDAIGHKMGKNDLWIASTARVFNLTVLTTDSDFDHLHDPHPTRPWRVDREWVDPGSKLTP
jgi:tRNA(fMet)-specific endonuclease VapC